MLLLTSITFSFVFACAFAFHVSFVSCWCCCCYLELFSFLLLFLFRSLLLSNVPCYGTVGQRVSICLLNVEVHFLARFHSRLLCYHNAAWINWFITNYECVWVALRLVLLTAAFHLLYVYFLLKIALHNGTLVLCYSLLCCAKHDTNELSATSESSPGTDVRREPVKFRWKSIRTHTDLIHTHTHTRTHTASANAKAAQSHQN